MKYPPLTLQVRLPSKASSEFRVIKKLIVYTKMKKPVADFARYFTVILKCKPIQVAERPKARVCGRSLAGIAGTNSAGCADDCLL